MNLKEGVVLCPSCGTLTRLSQLLRPVGDEAVAVDWSSTANDIWRQPPSGCSVRGSRDNIIIKATTRSLGTAAGLAFFAVFWNAIVSVFLVIAISGVYGYLIGKLPGWFPAPSGNKKSPIPFGISLFMLLFLTPFVLVGLGLIRAILVSLFGSVILHVEHGRARVSTGIGMLRRWRRFQVDEVTRVSLGEHELKWQNDSSNKPTRAVHIEAGKVIRAGNDLSEARMKWFGSAATLLLMGSDLQDVDELLATCGRDSRGSHLS